MSLPNSLSKLKNLGVVQEDFEIEGINFTLRNVNSKEHLDIITATSAVTDDTLRWELIKQKTLNYAIVSVDGQKVDNEELLKYLSDCSPVIIQYLFNKYLAIANKGADLVDKSVEKVALADSNIATNLMGSPSQPATNNEQGLQ
jgi:hypothetical protein